MNNNKECYMCENIATSKEHVPPKCFFLKDAQTISGKNFRKNLITVPACDLHNTGKSKDDQYLLFIICVEYESNSEAQQTYNIILKHAFYENPHLLEQFSIGGRISTIDGHLSASIPINRERFNREMDCISRAIYYHHFNEKWEQKLWIISTALRSDPLEWGFFKAVEYDAFLFQVRNWVIKETKNLVKYGENQEIFYYKVYDDPSEKIQVLILVFFEGFITIVFPENQLPFFSRFYLSPL